MTCGLWEDHPFGQFFRWPNGPGKGCTEKGDLVERLSATEDVAAARLDQRFRCRNLSNSLLH